MKRYIIFILIYTLSIVLHAQDNSYDYTPSNYSLIPPSPEVEELMKFNEIPVNYNTGLPDISYTLYTVKEGSLELPITIRYHGGGVKVDKEPGLLGYSWKLDAGGAIARSVNGLPDDYKDGTLCGLLHLDSQNKKMRDDIRAYNPNYDIVGDLSKFVELRSHIANQANEYYEGRIDMANDIFHISAIGLSGTFIFNEDAKCFISSEQGMRIKPSGNRKFEYFTVTSKQGTTLKFDVQEKSKVKKTVGPPFMQNEPNYSYNYVSSWHVGSITDIHGSSINFSYTEMPCASNTVSSSTVLRYHMPPNFAKLPPNHNNSIYTIQYYPQALTSISASNVEVYFEYIPWGDWGKKLLSKINIYEKSSPNTLGKLVKQFTLHYDGLGDGYLKEIRENGEPIYVFDYNEPDYSYGSDFGGYHNGSLGLSVPDYDNFGGGADRDVHPEYAASGALKSVEYQAGGKTIFDWESHTYSYINDRKIQLSEATDIKTPHSRKYTLSAIIDPAHNKLAEKNIEIKEGDKTYLDISHYFNITREYLTEDYHTRIHYPADTASYPNVRIYQITENGTASGKKLYRYYFIDKKTEQEVFKNSSLNIYLPPGKYDFELAHPYSVYGYEDELKRLFKWDYNNGAACVDLTIDSYITTQMGANLNYWPGLRIKRITSIPDNGSTEIIQDFFYDSTLETHSSGVVPQKPVFNYTYYITLPRYIKEGYVGDYVEAIGSNGLASSPLGMGIEYPTVRVRTGLPDRYTTPCNFSTKDKKYYFTSALEIENQDKINETAFMKYQPPCQWMYTSKAHLRGNLLKEEYIRPNDAGELDAIEGTKYEYNIFEDPYPGHFTTDLFVMADYTRQPFPNQPSVAIDYGIGQYSLIPYNKTVKSETYFDESGYEHRKKYEYFYDEYTDNIDYALVKSMSVSCSAGDDVISHYTYLKGEGSFLPDVETEIVTIGDDVVGGRRTIYSADRCLPVATYTLGRTGYKKNELVSNDKKTTQVQIEALNRPEYTYQYNQYGRIVEIRYRGRVLASYIWGYNGAYPVIEARGVAYATLMAGVDIDSYYNDANTDYSGLFNRLIQRLPDADMSLNRYHNLIGLMESRDSRGNVHYYDYDNRGRLSTVKDYNENILKQYRYVINSYED